jgi:hypothetical protein
MESILYFTIGFIIGLIPFKIFAEMLSGHAKNVLKGLAEETIAGNLQWTRNDKEVFAIKDDTKYFIPHNARKLVSKPKDCKYEVLDNTTIASGTPWFKNSKVKKLYKAAYESSRTKNA